MKIVVVDPSRLVLKSLSGMLAARGHDVRLFVDAARRSSTSRPIRTSMF
jgi:hypothetical protein